MKVIDELYLIPDNDQYVLYAPLKRTLLSVNQDLVLLLSKIKNQEEIPKDKNVLEVIDYLKNLGVLDSEEEYPENTGLTQEYCPTNLTLLPTTECNLRCIYCYADSGETSKNLPLNIAKTAVDFVINNARKKDVDMVQIGFLGGGEPFLKWDFVKNIVEYSKNQANKFSISTYFSAVTNGILSEKQVLWLSKNFQYLNVSLDGTKEIQDIHRPTKNQNGSYDTVIKTVSLLKSLGFKFSIRSTISSLSVNQMVPIVELFCNDLGVSKIHFEPLFACGRCRTNSELVPEVKDFVSNFKKCLDIVQSTDTELFCSAVRIDTLTSRFCGALEQNFYITPEGYVTACTEVSSKEEPLSDLFFIGKYDQEKKSFVFYNKKKSFLSKREVTNIEHCKRCISKWHCAGACPVKAAFHGDIFDPSQLANCEISRELTEHYLISLSHNQTNMVPRITQQTIDFSTKKL